MTDQAYSGGQPYGPASNDFISDILKWVLLATAIICFGLLGWATVLTYRAAPPQPQAFVDSRGQVLMTGDDIVAGKGGFQKADLMDYGSIYGMGSYFGEDYTASNLVLLGQFTRENLSNSMYGGAFAGLKPEQQAAVTSAMQRQLQTIDLTQPRVTVSDEVAAAIRSTQAKVTEALNTVKLSAGWTPARSLNPELRIQTADFIVYSSITTVARRPNMTSSWTENWPYEPLVGNVPTTNTFRWTWISFCFTFFAFGAVLFVYERYLNDPDGAPLDPVLAAFRPLTASQRLLLMFCSCQPSSAFCTRKEVD